ncbi:hypothetical protein BDF20DRAFT_908789 [Mycotypha africana]|uniref:uncharacterized protein n=1 Tax=Mycotypha africana TaxID=64632 RepID=UPI0022FFCE04|nr:uncharacterized protein BDF20DRAFT_908789 [Mycotypha africana]KAI8990965.1 hypothetical protein BDF20DRAFT_908789 [Mycotypha africana]
MLSASTLSSAHSSAFSANSGILTPYSQYSSSNDSAKKSNGNPLTELIETEQSFIENLKIIDSQIAPIWMKQMTSAAPDFSELLKLIHDILKVNKQFCMKLTNIAANPQKMKELGNALMQWVDSMDAPYSNYFRSFIPRLNTRHDIVKIQAIQDLLQNLSENAAYEITLESLFSAPVQQLKYYKGLYSRLLDSTEPDKEDYRLLLRASERINTIQKLMPKADLSTINDMSSNTVHSTVSRLPSINTNFDVLDTPQSELATFLRQVDCSRTVDLFNGTKINYELSTTQSGTQIVKRNNFFMMQNDGKSTPPTRMHLVLTTECLIICRECASTFFLMFPAISSHDVTVKADLLEREIVGEYILAFTMFGKKHITLRADSREIRNMWVGQSAEVTKVDLSNSRSLSAIVEQHLYCAKNDNEKKHANGIKKTDIFTYYSEPGAVSPLESSDEEQEETFAFFNTKQSNNSDSINTPRDTIMDIYNNHIFGERQEYEVKEPIPGIFAPQTVKILPQIPNVSQLEVQSMDDITANSSSSPNKGTFNVDDEKTSLASVPDEATTKGSGHVQLMYINAPIAQMSTMSITPPVEQPNELYQSSTSSSLSSSLRTTPPTTNSGASSTSSSTSFPSSPSTTTDTSTFSQKTAMPPQIQHSSNKIGPLTQQLPTNGRIGKSNDNKPSSPSSPMTVNIQTAASVPVAMQAVTQKKDEFLSRSQQQQQQNNYRPIVNNNLQYHARPPPTGLLNQRNDSIRQQQHPVIPRSSSIRGALPQQRPPPMAIYDNHSNIANQIAGQQQLSARSIAQNQHSLQQPGQLKPLPNQPLAGPNEYRNRPLPAVSTATGRSQAPQPQPQQQLSHPNFLQHQQPQYIPPSLSPSSLNSTGNILQPINHSQQPMSAPARPVQVGGEQQQQQQQRQQQQQQSLSSRMPSDAREPLNGSNSPIPTHYQHQQQLKNNNNSKLVEDLNSPPHSPDMFISMKYVRQVLYSNNQCEVFHWNNQSWYAVEGQCELQIKLTHTNRTCVTVQLLPNNQLYLNAWIMPTTVIRQPSPTDVNISLYLGQKKENYLIHFPQPQEANMLANTLYKAHQDAVTLQQQEITSAAVAVGDSDREPDLPEPVDTVNIPQTLKPLMQCKAKLFVKNETANWSTLGSVTMRISQQSPSLRMLIQIENDKAKLVSAIVRSGNVEKINSKRISFLLTDDSSKTSIVYMIHLREDQTGNKIYEYLRTKNAENGW